MRSGGSTKRGWARRRGRAERRREEARAGGAPRRPHGPEEEAAETCARDSRAGLGGIAGSAPGLELLEVALRVAEVRGVHVEVLRAAEPAGGREVGRRRDHAALVVVVALEVAGAP